MKRKVGIIGVGNVGSQTAFSLCTRGICDALVLIDKDEKKAQSHALDLNDMAAFTNPVTITTQDYVELRDADVIILAAGPEMMAQEDRLTELDETLEILDDVLPKVMMTGFDGIFLVITNPCDVVTYFVQKKTGLDHHRVFGTGTALDTARMKRILGNLLQVAPDSIEGYVLGEHGDSQFIPWSTVRLAGSPILEGLRASVEKETRDAGWAILQGKGCTNFGIGTTAATITKAILADERRIFPVSVFDEEAQVYLGLPAQIGREGIIFTSCPKLTEDEEKKLQHSIQVIQQAASK
ncbi:L-lactate dehydrogenase [Listeria weihenstephanensis]|uniref:L-lactate dehydrogenase n=1 Tax=Listeria weihenstephanensis TaxID=1006155 RepID=A0A841Z7F1_9LIST|nr:L-lactate dehydrogenase [Listeria weihenstephanensis]MBC1500799.1 L-lactate dehydrogenase [Listeria weihenstephanensis]